MATPSGRKVRDASSHQSQSSMAICTKCNGKTRAGSRFCNYCGTKFDDQPFITYDILYKSPSDGIRLTIPKDWIQINPQDLAKSVPDARWGFQGPAYEDEVPLLFVKSLSHPNPQAASQMNSVSILEEMVNAVLDTDDPSWHNIESSIDSVNGIDTTRIVRQSNENQMVVLEVDTIRNGVLHQITFGATKSYQFYYPTFEEIIDSLEVID
jgi:hypothetical protein